MKLQIKPGRDRRCKKEIQREEERLKNCAQNTKNGCILFLCRHAADTNLIFIVNKSHWPYYHYLLPWDYQTGEFGTYGAGCSTAFIRIFAAVGWAKQLKTIDSEAVKEALSLAVDTDTPLVECLNKVGLQRASKIPDDHVLNYELYK